MPSATLSLSRPSAAAPRQAGARRRGLPPAPAPARWRNWQLGVLIAETHSRRLDSPLGALRVTSRVGELGAGPLNQERSLDAWHRPLRPLTSRSSSNGSSAGRRACTRRRVCRRLGTWRRRPAPAVWPAAAAPPRPSSPPTQPAAAAAHCGCSWQATPAVAWAAGGPCAQPCQRAAAGGNTQPHRRHHQRGAGQPAGGCCRPPMRLVAAAAAAARDARSLAPGWADTPALPVCPPAPSSPLQPLPSVDELVGDDFKESERKKLRTVGAHQLLLSTVLCHSRQLRAAQRIPACSSTAWPAPPRRRCLISTCGSGTAAAGGTFATWSACLRAARYATAPCRCCARDCSQAMCSLRCGAALRPPPPIPPRGTCVPLQVRWIAAPLAYVLGLTVAVGLYSTAADVSCAVPRHAVPAVHDVPAAAPPAACLQSMLGRTWLPGCCRGLPLGLRRTEH